MKHLFLFALLFISGSTIGQPEDAKKIIKDLTAEKMHGRGYVKKGDKRAAKYIKKQFKEIGLHPIGKSYYQKFSFPINTQPGTMELKIDNTQLTPGVDFLIDPASPSIEGTFETLVLTPKNLLNPEIFFNKLNNSSGKILLINCYNTNNLPKQEKTKVQEIINYLRYSPEHPALATIVFSTEKLTWSGSTMQAKKASFTIAREFDLESIETITIKAKSVFKKKYTSQNCIGYIPGVKKDSIIMVSAHYDHLGQMGSRTYFPGANDNASGVAMLLELASYFSQPHNKPKYTMVFIAFGAEEIGLLGSKYYTENPVFPLEQTKFLINLDLSGTGDEGIQVVNGSIFKTELNQLRTINNKHNLLKDVKTRGSACNSDHCYFYEKEVPCFFIYTLGGIKAYHDIYDKYETLPMTEFTDYKQLLTLFIKQL